MCNEKQNVGLEGCKPVKLETNGYKPARPTATPISDSKPHGGYQPTSAGENPTNRPTPPSDE